MLTSAIAGVAAAAAAFTYAGFRTVTLLLLLALAALFTLTYLRLGGPREARTISPRSAQIRAALGLLVFGAAALALAATIALDRRDRPERPDPGPSPEVTRDPAEILAPFAPEPLGDPDPDAAHWEEIPRARVSLTAQPMVAPRPAETRTDRVDVQAVHDGERVAFRLSWEDPEEASGGGLGEQADGVAIQFPVDATRQTPVAMGRRGSPVHIYHWRADFQRDDLGGKPGIRDLFPNAVVDLYPMDPPAGPRGSEEEQRAFIPGYAAGNPRSRAVPAVLELFSEGFGTTASVEGQGAQARGAWDAGAWSVVISRPLEVDEGAQLYPGRQQYIALAAWRGDAGEVGARKSVTMQWTALRLKP